MNKFLLNRASDIFTATSMYVNTSKKNVKTKVNLQFLVNFREKCQTALLIISFKSNLVIIY